MSSSQELARQAAQLLENYVVPFIGAKTLSTNLLPRSISDYVDWRKAKGGIRSVTVNKELSCIKAMFRFAEERGHVAESPARRVKLLQSDSIVRDRFLTHQEYEILLAKAHDDREGLRSTLFNDRREWISLACNAGLRPGEQRFLEFGDIDLRHDFLRIQSKPRFGFQVKNYQHRYVPLPPDARDAVQAQWAKKHASSDFVFHRPDGSPWGDIGGSFDELIVSSGLQKQQPAERVTPHSLRAHLRQLVGHCRRKPTAHSGAPRAQEHHHHRTVFASRPEWRTALLP